MLNDLIAAIKESFETSTRSENKFSSLVKSTVWNNIVTDDDSNDTMYFSDEFVLIAESLDPFSGERPYIIHMDGSMINL